MAAFLLHEEWFRSVSSSEFLSRELKAKAKQIPCGNDNKQEQEQRPKQRQRARQEICRSAA